MTGSRGPARAEHAGGTAADVPGLSGTARRALAPLRERGYVTGATSRWGVPVWCPVAGHAPQALVDANRMQKRVAELAYALPWPGPDSCAAWAEGVVAAAGLGTYGGSARELYEAQCHLDDPACLLVGMAVAVPATPWSPSSAAHGHVGLYVGDGLVRDSTDARVRTVPLDAWLVAYGVMAPPRWGWVGGVALA